MAVLHMRPYRDEKDYWRLRALLRETLPLNEYHLRNWHVARLDYWRWHVIENCHLSDEVAQVTFLWESDATQLAAVLHTDGRGEVCFEIHPDHYTSTLLEDMLAAAEEHLAIVGGDAQRRLRVWCSAHRNEQETLLRERGYQKVSGAESIRRRRLDLPIPDVSLLSGYIVRSLGEECELPARSWASWKAFHPDESDERYAGWEWYRNIQKQPLYRRDLDLVAVAPGGELAAFCTIWYDDATRTGQLEPVGTHPAYQRRGLSKAVMCEGLRRLRRMGATIAYVGSYSPAAHAAYEAVGFSDYELSEPWELTW
jgi:GNAT superfamily N-acetyltransferase